MASVQKGKAVVWSVGSNTITGGILSATTTSLPQSLSVSRTGDSKRVMDNDGTIRAVIYHSFMKRGSMSVVPDASATTSVGTALDGWLPTIGSGITVVDGTYGSTVLGDSYNITSATHNRTVDGVGTVDVEFEAGDEGVELAGTAL